jgi:spermidine synthase
MVGIVFPSYQKSVVVAFFLRSEMIVDGWFYERGELWPGQSMSLEVKQVLDHHRSQFQDLLVFESTNYGNVLVLDGVIQVTERDEFAYQEMIAHIPLFSHPNPKKVLVIGGGDGGVLREIAKHSSVEEIVLCEIDKDVIEASKRYFPAMARGFDDPRVTVQVMDGAEFLSANQDSFDVIITDSSDPVGPASVLFETPFYNAMHASLRDGGIVCTQGECIWLHVDLIRPLVQAISKLYSTVEYAYTTIPTYPSGQIGFIVAAKGREKCSTPSRSPSTDLLATMQYYTPELHSASFVLPAFARRAIFGR